MDSLSARLAALDPDAHAEPVFAIAVSVKDHAVEVPTHAHRHGQLVVALQGAVTCRAEGGLWMAPIGSGVWIPGGVPHSNHVTINGAICLLFVDPAVPDLPPRCCTLPLSSMVIELIRHLAATEARPGEPADGQTRRIIEVILEELRRIDATGFHLPITDDPTLRLIADALIRTPEDRASVATWAARVAMSERALARLVVRETALSFGRWRQQFHIVTALQKLSAGASVQAVALDLGYGSVSAFIAMFKAALGVSPARYVARMTDPHGRARAASADDRRPLQEHRIAVEPQV
jgi:AraC-like DNA-binding protein